MDLALSGRRVLITGGSKGIGLACAKAFVAEGARVGIVSRDTANLEAARAQVPGLWTAAANLIDPAAAADVVDQIGRAHV